MSNLASGEEAVERARVGRSGRRVIFALVAGVVNGVAMVETLVVVVAGLMMAGLNRIRCLMMELRDFVAG